MEKRLEPKESGKVWPKDSTEVHTEQLWQGTDLGAVLKTRRRANLPARGPSRCSSQR